MTFSRFTPHAWAAVMYEVLVLVLPDTTIEEIATDETFHVTPKQADKLVQVFSNYGYVIGVNDKGIGIIDKTNENRGISVFADEDAKHMVYVQYFDGSRALRHMPRNVKSFVRMANSPIN